MNTLSGQFAEAQNCRVTVALTGRVILRDGSEHACVTRDISPHDVSFSASSTIKAEDIVAAEISGIGRIDGTAMAVCFGRFILQLKLGSAKRGRLSRRIEVLTTREERRGLVSKYQVIEDAAQERRFCRNLETVVRNLVSNSVRAS